MLRHIYTYDKVFQLEAGGSLDSLTICYHTSCEERGDKPVIWICHALTANSNPEEWWDTLVGKGLLFDTEKYYIVCANIIGSCYGTTGPTTYPKAPLRNFPLVTIRDLVRAHDLLREHLGIDKVDLLIGGSNGGFQSVEWAASFPDRIKNLCLIATSAIVSPWCTATLEAQRMAIKADPTFDASKDASGGMAGLAAARSMALVTYRNYEGYGRTQFETNPDFLIANRAVTYQQYQGQKLCRRFDAYSYYYLTLGVDTHNVGRKRGGVEKALAGITAKTLCIAIDSDILFPVSESRRLAEGIPGASLEVITSDFGHDGFLLEHEQISKCINKHFDLCKF